MNDDTTDDGAEGGEDAETDAGAPVTVLSDLEEPVAAGFLTRLRSRIERRRLAGEVVSVGWHLPFMVLLEFWNMVCQLILPSEDGKGDAQ